MTANRLHLTPVGTGNFTFADYIAGPAWLGR